MNFEIINFTKLDVESFKRPWHEVDFFFWFVLVFLHKRRIYFMCYWIQSANLLLQQGIFWIRYRLFSHGRRRFLAFQLFTWDSRNRSIIHLSSTFFVFHFFQFKLWLIFISHCTALPMTWTYSIPNFYSLILHWNFPSVKTFSEYWQSGRLSSVFSINWRHIGICISCFSVAIPSQSSRLLYFHRCDTNQWLLFSTYRV